MTEPHTLLLEAYLKRLKLPAMKRHYRSLAREAVEQNRTFEEYLLALVEQEVLQRDDNQLRARLKLAGFPVPHTLDSFEFSAIPSLNKQKVLTLAQCEFVAEKENVILCGNSGTGKTHVVTALGMCACRKGYRVRFWTGAGLVQELLEARHEHRLTRLEKQWLKIDLVVLDDIGYVPFSQAGAELLWQFMAARYQRGSVAITTNLDFGEWPKVFGDEKMTAALLDRLTHRAHILAMNGDSYRFKESLRRQQVANE